MSAEFENSSWDFVRKVQELMRDPAYLAERATDTRPKVMLDYRGIDYPSPEEDELSRAAFAAIEERVAQDPLPTDAELAEIVRRCGITAGSRCEGLTVIRGLETTRVLLTPERSGD